jgi:farnesyl-diphosphate farnesyltransferase
MRDSRLYLSTTTMADDLELRRDAPQPRAAWPARIGDPSAPGAPPDAPVDWRQDIASSPGEPLRPEQPLHAAGIHPASEASATADDALQQHLLEGVSRTFALTIPRLPDPLRRVVGNAYLLCRVADTIEDDPGLDPCVKAAYQEGLLEVLRGAAGSHSFAAALHAELSAATPAAERELVLALPRVLGVTAAFSDTQRQAIIRCLTIMGRGMSDFGHSHGREGLADLGELDRYCYTVAGVVGELLTELFCDAAPDIAARRDLLAGRAVRFGRGLQMTNILKDVWEDLAHGRCWLPRQVFAGHGCDLSRLAPGHGGVQERSFATGLRELIGVAHADLREALEYTLSVPPRHTGIRAFLALAVLFAALTLRNLHARPLFSEGAQVKVPRWKVAATVTATRAVIRSRLGVTILFRLAARGLPLPAQKKRSRRAAVQPALSSEPRRVHTP